MRTRVLRLVAAGICVGASAVGLVAAPASSAAGHAPDVAKSGHWYVLDPTSGVLSATPTVWRLGSGTAFVLWLRQPSASEYTYSVSRVAGSGQVTAPVDIFAGAHWGSLSNEPTLVGSGTKPVVVFNGTRTTTGPYSKGCAYGALGPSGTWKLQTWSLSNNCVNPVGAAGEGKNNQLAYAFPGGWVNGHGVLYRIGISPTIPATGTDQHIGLPGGDTAYKTGVVANTGGTGHWYVAWAQEFSNNRDGYYVKDVTAGTATIKAPGSGTQSINHLTPFADLAIAARSGQPGVYLAYCSNSNSCALRLWRVGAPAAMAIPHGTGNPFSVSISAGPDGRMWVAWYDNTTNRLSVVRTNKAVTRFGAVQSYPTPCFEDGLIGLSGGPSSRLDVALQCYGTKQAHTIELEGQTIVGLAASASPAKVSNTSSHKVTVTVTDAGDPVAGATVKYGSQHPKTNSNGRASVTIAKGTSVGKHVIHVLAGGYMSTQTSVTVTHD